MAFLLVGNEDMTVGEDRDGETRVTEERDADDVLLSESDNDSTFLSRSGTGWPKLAEID